MSDPLDPAQERQLAVDLFNTVWAFLEAETRSETDDDAMIHAAHASCHHWRAVGTAANAARGEWQCSRVYATLGRSEPARHHAERCLALVDAGGEGFEDWDRAAALEALARAMLVAEDHDAATAYAVAARKAVGQVTDLDDAAHIAADLDELGLD